MRTFVKRGVTLIIATIMMFSSSVVSFAATGSPQTAPTHVTTKNVETYMKRKLNLNNNGYTALIKMADSKKNQTYVTVPDSLTVKATGVGKDGKSVTSKMKYKVGVIGGKAFAKGANMKAVKLGKYVYQVNKEAFTPNKKLNKIVITGTGKIKFCKGCFNGLKVKNIKVVVNSKMNKNLQRQLKANLHALGFTNKLLASNVTFVKM